MHDNYLPLIIIKQNPFSHLLHMLTIKPIIVPSMSPSVQEFKANPNNDHSSTVQELCELVEGPDGHIYQLDSNNLCN